MRVGFEFGHAMDDPHDPGNEIGEPEKHVEAPKNGVYYSLTEQNCFWWATIMLKQSGIPVSDKVYECIKDDMGIGE
jgi:hypothetical protein